MSKNCQIKCAGQCCYHIFHGAIHMVVPDGHIVMQCCTCHHMMTAHRDHTHPLPKESKKKNLSWKYTGPRPDLIWA